MQEVAAAPKKVENSDSDSDSESEEDEVDSVSISLWFMFHKGCILCFFI